jgi:hypothetical protein
MTRTKLGLIGLCAIVIGVMAISAGTAEGALSWLALNSAGTEAKELTAALTAEQESTHYVTLSSPGGLMISVVCMGTHASVVGGFIGAFFGFFTITLLNCEVRAGTFNGNVLGETTKLPCTVSTSGAAAGTIVTKKLKGKLVLNASKEVLVETAPEIGTTLAVLLFSGEECSLPEEDPLTGVVFFKDCENKMLVHAVKHLWEEGPGTSLKLGSAPATLRGSFWLKLSGAHTGLAWAAMDV